MIDASAAGDPTYEIYAIRFGRSERRHSESFIGGDLHDGPIGMAYYVWLIRGDHGAIVVDTGFDRQVAAARQRELLVAPDEALRRLGVDPDVVEHVVLTHLHYDHAGNHQLFPRARFHVQAEEMAYVTGPWMCHRHLRQGYDPEDVITMVRRLFADRVVFHRGDGEVMAGVTVHDSRHAVQARTQEQAQDRTADLPHAARRG
jgi:glyoxylase-like metal-dependent hydrolase (beta-lactamase superfamily II)